MEEIGKFLPSIFKRQVRRVDPRLVEILKPLWPRVAGKAIATHSQPVAFGAGTLTLAVSCPSWAAQLRRMAEEIRAKINSFLGGPGVKKLRVHHVPDLNWPELPAPQQEFPLPLETPTAQWTDSGAQLDPEIARIVERSFAKYFSRGGRGVD